MDATQHFFTRHEHTKVPRADAGANAGLRDESTCEDLKPARGIMLGIVIGAALWTVILGAGWLIFR